MGPGQGRIDGPAVPVGPEVATGGQARGDQDAAPPVSGSGSEAPATPSDAIPPAPQGPDIQGMDPQVSDSHTPAQVVDPSLPGAGSAEAGAEAAQPDGLAIESANPETVSVPVGDQAGEGAHSETGTGTDAVAGPSDDGAAGSAPASDPATAPESVPEPADDPAPEAPAVPGAQTAPVAESPAAAPVATPAGPGPVLAAPVAPASGGIFRPILGGVIAAALGAGAALYLLPQGWQPVPAPDLRPLEQRLAALEGRPATTAEAPDLGPLESRMAALEAAAPPEAAPPPDLGPVEDRIAALEAALPSRITQEVAAAVDSAVAGAVDAAVAAALDSAVEAAVTAAMGEARAALASEAEEIAASAEEVAAAQARAEALAALGELGLAADSGAPAAEALARLAALGALPDGIAAFAEGLPTLGALQAGFAPAARAALAAAPPPEGAGPGDRVLNFLRSQTGARSLAPRAGDDPDAILSRAEAAVRQGDLPAALAQIEALPAPSAAALAGWRAQAELRLAALAGLNALAARLGQE